MGKKLETPKAASGIVREPEDASSSRAVAHDGTLYLSAQVADVALATVAEQTQAIVDQIDVLLARFGTSKRKLLTATIYCSDSRHFDEVNTRWDAWVPWHDPPGCNYLVAKLRTQQHKVSIQVTAGL